MEKFSGNYIDCYEKKVSVQQIYQMYRSDRMGVCWFWRQMTGCGA